MMIGSFAYLIGVWFTHRMIVDSNIPDTNPYPCSSDPEPNPSNLSPTWALIWPIFWLKTIPVFLTLQREEKYKNKER